MDAFGGIFPKNLNASSLEYFCAMEVIRQGNDAIVDSGLKFNHGFLFEIFG